MGVVDKLLGSSEEIVLYAKKNAPRLISIGSSILTVGACAGTGIATWKAKDKLEDHNIKLKVLHADLEAAEEDGTEEEVIEIKKDIMKEYGKTCLTIAGYYAVPAGLLAGSIACDIVSSKQYEHKLALASGSLFLLKGAWDKAQERAKEELGEEKAADIFYGGKEKEVKYVDEKGKEKVKKIKEYNGEDIIAANPCSVLLGDGIPSVLDDVMGPDGTARLHILRYNIDMIHSKERYWTYKLWQRYQDPYRKDKGVYVKEVYDSLEINEASKYEHTLWSNDGWVLTPERIENARRKCKLEGIDPDEEDPDTGLTPVMSMTGIKLGIDDIVNKRYVEGDEPMVWIVPNHMGDITQLIYPDESFIEATAI